ncbi:MAG: FeoA family protein [Proteobacteria bacterium]|nr:FeoA family protein [Pseudomonadota bacterium]
MAHSLDCAAYTLKLSDLDIAQKADIIGYTAPASDEERVLVQSMQEMGLTPGSPIEIMHFGPFGRDPIAIYCRGSLIGVGRKEAHLMIVKARHS